MDKVICVDIDDTLNNFSEVLEKLKVKHKDYEWIYKDEQAFNDALHKLKTNTFTKEEYGQKDFSYLYNLIHQEVYKKAKPKPDAIKFMHWLKQNDWKIIILTYRDLRKSLEITKYWFNKYKIPYDYFFSTTNKVVFCGIWKIKHLIDDDPYNIVAAPGNGINLYYPITKKSNELSPEEIGDAIGFESFKELYEVIR